MAQFRKCVLCGKVERKGETTYGFRTALRILGKVGDKAHPSCVREALAKKDKEDAKHKRSRPS